jgi:uncharacterized protein (DUF433 family)
MLAEIDIGTLIQRRPELRGGRPIVAGTGVSVHRIAGWYRLGLSPEEIAENYGHLSLAQVHAALAYYHANREEIEGYLRDEEAEEDRLRGSVAPGRSVAFALYLDEDSVNRALIRALQARGMDVTNAVDSGQAGTGDLEQLEHATAHGRVLFTYNVRHFYELHTPCSRSTRLRIASPHP